MTYDYDAGDYSQSAEAVNYPSYTAGRGHRTSQAGAQLGNSWSQESNTRQFGTLGLRRFWRGRPALTGIDSSFNRNSSISPGITEGEGKVGQGFITARNMWNQAGKKADAKATAKAAADEEAQRNQKPAKDYGPPDEQDISGFATDPRPVGAVPAGTDQFGKFKDENGAWMGGAVAQGPSGASPTGVSMYPPSRPAAPGVSTVDSPYAWSRQGVRPVPGGNDASFA
jgi:hypothetical protein